jgi:hypothetical protein
MIEILYKYFNFMKLGETEIIIIIIFSLIRCFKIVQLAIAFTLLYFSSNYRFQKIFFSFSLSFQNRF